MSRRPPGRLVQIVCLLLAGPLLACDPTPSAQWEPVGGTGGPVNLIVSAHPDDDILFMNPDLAAALSAGQPTVGIFLTAGESNLPDAAGYAAQRQRGTRAAYARMAGLPDDWHGEPWAADDRHVVEMYSLKANPAIKTVWLNLPDDNDPRTSLGRNALTTMWFSPRSGMRVSTLVPAGGVVATSYTYDHEDLVRVLATAMERFRPTVLRAQDPAPDPRYQPHWRPYHDHPDHVMAARFTRKAAARYTASTGSHRFVEVNYRDYNGMDAPVNLAPHTWQSKRDYFAAYAPHDSEVSLGSPYDEWIKRTYYRWSRRGRWAVLDAEGRLHAFAVLGSRLMRWTREPGGPWRGPEPVPNAPALRPGLDVVGPEPTLVGRGVAPPDVALGPGEWRQLGSPDPRGGADLGSPCSTVDPAGRRTVVVTNGRGGVSGRTQPTTGTWEPGWRDLGGGGDVQGAPTCLTDRAGLVHAFAVTRQRVLHWRQPTPGGPLVAAAEPMPGVRPAGPVSATLDRSGRIWLVARTADTGEFAVSTHTDGAAWLEAGRLPAPGGMDAATVSAHGADGVLLLTRDDHGRTVLVVLRPNATAAEWAPLDGVVLDHPTAVSEPDGSVTLLALRADATLVTSRVTPIGVTPWQKQ